MARQQADALTARMEAKYVFTAVVNVQEQFDSNVVLKPDDASAAANISGASDRITVLALRAEYAPAFKLPYGLKFQYNGYVNAHDKLKAYDLQNHTLAAVPSYRIGENSLSMPLTYSTTLLDGSKYLQVFSLAPTYAFVTGEFQYAQASLAYQKKDYLLDPAFPEENRDSNDLVAGISWFRLISQQKGFTSLKYELNKEKTVGANWSYLGNKLSAGMLTPFTDRAKLALGIEAFRQDFDHIHSVFGVKRADTTYTANAQVLYALTHSIDAQLQYVVVKNDSTIPVYGYHKNIVSIGVYARF
jgi:hypothetical protein